MLLIVGVPSSVYAYNTYNYNKFYNEGQSNLENEKYDEAIGNFSTALKYGEKYSEEINKKINLIKDLKSSKATYEEGMKKFNEKEYLDAVSIFEKIKKEDTERYKLSQEKIAEAQKMYIGENISKAQKEAVNKKYVEGIKYLDLALKIDSKNGQALKLKTDYKNLYINENLNIAKQQAAEKNYKEAIEYLDLVFKIDSKNDTALKLKDEYNKAIQNEEAEKLKAEKLKEEQQEKNNEEINKASSKSTSNNSSSNEKIVHNGRSFTVYKPDGKWASYDIMLGINPQPTMLDFRVYSLGVTPECDYKAVFSLNGKEVVHNGRTSGEWHSISLSTDTYGDYITAEVYLKYKDQTIKLTNKILHKDPRKK